MISRTKLIYAFPCILFFVCCPGWLVILIQVDIRNQIDLCFPLSFLFRFLSSLISHLNSSWYPKLNWVIFFACILFFVCSPSWLVILIQVDIQNQIELFFRFYFVFRLFSWFISHFNSSWSPKPNLFILSLLFFFSFVVLVD